MGKRARAAAADDESDDAPSLREWEDSATEGDGPQSGAEARIDVLVRNESSETKRARVIDSAPIHDILVKTHPDKQPTAWGVVLDLGGGLHGFAPVKELVEKESVDMLSRSLVSMLPCRKKPGEGPDTRPRMRLLRVNAPSETHGQFREHDGDKQLRLGGRLERISECFDDKLASAPGCVKNLLKYLHDRDRAASFTRLAGIRVGNMMDGIVEKREEAGLVLSITLPNPPVHREKDGTEKKKFLWELDPPRNGVIAVAVGQNALMPSEADTAKCRILDYDVESGVCDVTVAGSAVNAAAAERKVATVVTGNLAKGIGKRVKCQVVLRKPTYAVVQLNTHLGLFAYIVDPRIGLKPLPRGHPDPLKVGARIEGRVEYVRTRPDFVPAPKVKGGVRPPSRWELKGRRFRENSDDEDSDEEKAKEDEEKRSFRKRFGSRQGWLQDHIARRAEIPLQDYWLLPEPFVILTLAVDPPTDVAAPAAGPAAAAAAPKPAVEQSPAQPAVAPKRKREAIEVGFEWREDTVGAAEGTPPALALDADQVEPKKKRRREKKLGSGLAEPMVDAQERARVDDTAGPKTPDDFERLIMASPQSSYVWCQFIAFYVAQREYEKARQIAERALKTILMTESQELHNVWVAYLNIENLYGTQESMQAVFRRFEQRTDDKLKAHMTLVDIGISSQIYPLVYRTYKTILNKYGSETIDPWVSYAKFLLQRGNQDELNKTQKRMLSCGLPEKQVVQALIKIGCLQYREGSIDRGRTIFDGLVLKYPKRTDVWSVYLDMEQVVLSRLGDKSRIRNVFDRVTSLSMSSKKMQYFLTRYAAFERDHGDEKRQEYVKERAISFVNQKLGDGGEGAD